MHRNFIVACFLILCSLSVCFGQKTNSKPKPKRCAVRVDCSQPSIYLTYEEIEPNKVKSDSDDEQTSLVRLRFHNNTRGQILLKAGGGVTQDEARLFYEFLDDDNLIVESTYCHVCSLMHVPGGKSFPFRVPLEYFNDAIKMRISFNYEWEYSSSTNPGIEPVHYVYFNTPVQLKKQ